MAVERVRRSKISVALMMTILSLLLLTPFTVYYLWTSPHLFSKGLIYAPSPMLHADVHCQNGSTSQGCPMCSENVAPTILTYHSGYVDHTRCPLNQPFTVYVYQNDAIPVHYTSDLEDIEEVLKHTDSWTDIPNRACLFLCLVGPLNIDLKTEVIQNRLNSLPLWNNGINHILVDIPEVGHFSYDISNFSSAIIANGQSLNQFNLDFMHILVPPVLDSRKILTPRPLYIDPKSYTLFFEGESSKGISSPWLDFDSLSKLKFNVRFNCENAGGIIHNGFDGEWSLCTTYEQQHRNCADSTFSLVLGLGANYTSSVTYVRLIEALRCGTVPVVVGVKRLPFDHVINWNKAAILLSTLLLPRALSTLLTHFQPETLMEYRRQGRFLYETYFSSRKTILHSIIAILRSKLMHPPPAAPEFNGKIFLVNDDNSKVLTSPRFLNNFTIYSEQLWNNPPGPFYMYPVTPYRVPYIPTMFNRPAHASPDNFNPPILKGDRFRSSLHGIHPTEGFTVVALTYHRSQHLTEFVRGFEGCPFLAKIVIVWNNEKEPDSTFMLPNIGVPIEIVTTGKNSLNNRFLPFSNIETEAVLTIDDDQKIPHGEIQLAFRVWRENRDQIVGWYDRFVYWDPGKQLWYYSWDVSCEPSLALTGAAMYHKYYNYLYSYWMPESIRDVVDKSMNGEDLAMNFLIAYISRKPPLKVDSKSNLHGCLNCGSSISTQSNHLAHRSKCVNEFVRIWGYNTLLGTQFRTEPALKSECITNM